MPRPGLIAARNHWCLHSDQLAQEFDGILNLTETFPGCAKSPEGSIFYAPLSSNLNELIAGLSPNYSRPLEALYERVPGQWDVAGDGVPRFESGALLMEPAGSNKNVNWNANPDAGLIGLSIEGDPAGVLRRVNDAALIAASGLSSICSDGNVIEVDATACASFTACNCAGTTGNVNAHSYSAFCRMVTGGETGSVQANNGQVSTPFSHTDIYRRVAGVGPNSSTSARLHISVPPGAVARFVLNGLVEEEVLSSPIITRGASASRSGDILNYPNINSIFNQAQGMVSADWVPKHIQTDRIFNVGIMTLEAVPNILYYNQSNDKITAFDGINVSSVSTAPYAVGDSIRCVTIYGPAGTGADRLSCGIYQNGAWAWDENNNRTYTGPWPASADALRLMYLTSAPGRISNVTIWDENKGRAWMEANTTP